MRSFLRRRTAGRGPIFTFKNGTYLTRDRLARFLARHFVDTRINTHSFRIGGATALSQAGIPDSQIQILGRWRSNCFVRYLRIPQNNAVELSRKMSNIGCRQ